MGLLTELSEKIAAMRQHSKDKKSFLDELLKAASHGKLTDLEMNELHNRYKQLGLLPDDLKSVRVQAYIAALRADETDGQVTAEEEADLRRLQTFLMIPDAEIATSKRQLVRLRLLSEIKNGNPPTISVANIVLQRGEVAYWSEAGSLIEERVVSRRYEGASQGFSFHIARGVTYRIGAQHGHLLADKAAVAVSSGNLIITNKRIVFVGDMKSFNIPFGKVLNLNLFSDGIRVTDSGGKPRLVKFVSGEDSDLVGATLSLAINKFTN